MTTYWKIFEKIRQQDYIVFFDILTAAFFENGATSVPTKSRNPSICGWGDPFYLYLTHS